MDGLPASPAGSLPAVQVLEGKVHGSLGGTKGEHRLITAPSLRSQLHRTHPNFKEPHLQECMFIHIRCPPGTENHAACPRPGSAGT